MAVRSNCRSGQGWTFRESIQAAYRSDDAQSHKLLEVRFVTHRSIGMTPRTAERIVKQVAVRAGIPKQVTPHILRHTFAVNCIKASVSTASLKKLLGHDRLETTEIYLNISPEDALFEFRQKVLR